ncbi:MAG: type II toxin-antitoxin system MqsA family antitoxin [Gemmatimonadota bacterium]|nr:type II toxin-antitoxin system MqsA family antitoxin [Gemmatimonadota bacterium]MDE2984522.1 type II toxin-antitoxin system MqsA family antitoxin [Gemmatimonadota bacterium]
MAKPNHEMTPARIRTIRKRLNLTQEEAGKLLGGGARAFTKYESGTMRPRAAASNLLRVLEAHPGAAWVLRGDDAPPPRPRAPSPFDVQGEDLADLRAHQLHELLRRLLSVEAQANGIPLHGIHVSSNIAAADGGEDGRIAWQGGPEWTNFLPSRLCQFQLKAGEIAPSRAGREVVARGRVKPMVRAVLEDGGHYVLLCTRRYTQEKIAKREERIHAALADAGLVVPPDRIHFRDADKIAGWVNAHPSVGRWVQEKVGLGRAGLFASWGHWRGRSEHLVPWVEDDRLSLLRGTIRERLTQPRTFLRVVGLSGVGKSRLCLEALGGTGGDPTTGRPVRDLVMYAVLSEMPDRALSDIVDQLASAGARAVVVVDDCDPESHDTLVRLVRRTGSEVSLLTIDDEIPAEPAIDTHTVRIAEAPGSVVEGVVEHVAATLSTFDRHRLARMADGFPEVAIRIVADAGATQLFDPRPERLVTGFVLGRDTREGDLLLRCAMLLAAFRVVRVEPTIPAWPNPSHTQTTEDCLAPVAALGRGLTWEDLHAAACRLKERGVLKRRGGLGSIQPRPIAIRLAERQWREWDRGKWDRVFSGDLGSDLTRVAAERLAQMGGRPIATEVAKHVCRDGGPLDSGVSKSARADILSCLAQVDVAAVAEHIERFLDDHPDPSLIGDDERNGLLRALSRIAFSAAAFAVGTHLMLRLLEIRDGVDSEHVARPFTDLFPAVSGATEADGNARLAFLDQALEASDAARLTYLARALASGCDLGSHLSAIGPEVHGSRRTLNRWHPATQTELREYLGGCIARLATLAIRKDDIGAWCRNELGGSIAHLIHHSFIDDVEQSIQRVVGAGHRWTLALRQLHGALVHFSEAIDDATAQRVRSLIDLLAPTDLYDRVRALVTDPPMPDDSNIEPISEQVAAMRIKIDALADELLQQPTALRDILPRLSRERQVHATELGESIANRARSPLNWLDPIVEAVGEVPDGERNHDLLLGFVAALTMQRPDHAESIKQRAIESSALAPAFPALCRRIGLTSADVGQGIDGLARGTIPSAAMVSWMRPETLAPLPHEAVADLLDALFDHDATSFAIGVTTLWMMTRDEDRKSEEAEESGLRIGGFRPQVLAMARNSGRWRARDSQASTPPADWCFAQVMLRALGSGHEDDHARETALAFSKALTYGHRNGWLDPLGRTLRDVLRELLSGFPGIAWQLIGSEIVANERFARLMKFSLGERGEPSRGDPPILALSEEVLLAWCHASPERAPAFLAGCLPVLATPDESANPPLHPVMSRVIDEFGQRSDVREAFEHGLSPKGVYSSLANHHASQEGALATLRNHRTPEVRRWARRLHRETGRVVDSARVRNEEMGVGG